MSDLLKSLLAAEPKTTTASGLTYKEAMPLSPEEISRQLREAGLGHAEQMARESVEAGKPAKRLASALQLTFPLFSSGAFIFYLQGLPNLPSAQAIDALTLDQVFTTPGLLRFKPLYRSGKGKAWTKEALTALDVLSLKAASPEGRLELTSMLYQSDNKVAHMDFVQTLVALGVPMQINRVANRVNAEDTLEQWKLTITQWMATNDVLDPANYLATQAGGKIKPLTANEMRNALNSL